jgi:hypothetical protein
VNVKVAVVGVQKNGGRRLFDWFYNCRISKRNLTKCQNVMVNNVREVFIFVSRTAPRMIMQK